MLQHIDDLEVVLPAKILLADATQVGYRHLRSRARPRDVESQHVGRQRSSLRLRVVHGGTSGMPAQNASFRPATDPFFPRGTDLVTIPWHSANSHALDR